MSGDKLTYRERFSFGFGDLASCLYWQTFMVYLTFFYTDVFGISALAAGAMLGLSRSLDAFFDPVMGMMADRTQTRWGKFRPYLLWFCVPMAVAGVLTFTTPGAGVSAKLLEWFGEPVRAGCGVLAGGFDWLSRATEWTKSVHLGFVHTIIADLATQAGNLKGDVTGGLIWAILTYNLLMILYTAINIPYTAMLGVISPNPNERTTLSSFKFGSAFSAGIIVSATLLFLAKGLGGGNPQRGWQLAFVIVGVAVVGLFLTTFFNTKERVNPPKEQKTSVLRDLGDLVTNWPWLILVFTTLTFILFVAVRSSVTTHYFKYFVGTREVWLPFIGTKTYEFEWLVSAFNTTGQFASLLGAVLVPFYAKRIGRKLAFMTLFVVAILCTASYYFLKPDQVWLILGINLIGSITGGPLSALIWVMYADTADYAEWKKGRRATGLVFSASIFSQKQGWAIGAAIGLGLLSSVGFQANAVQTPEALNGLVRLMSTIPCYFGIASIIFVILYPLNEKKVAEIGAALKARRIAAGEEPAS